MEEGYIKNLLEKVVSSRDLSENEAYKAFNLIFQGEFTPSQIASFLTALKIKGENAAEIAGAATAMRENALSIPVDADFKDELVDTCGTGGDSKGTFNISTCASFIAAGAGVKIAKHGNYAVSSRSGSADVLRELGVNIFLKPEQVLKSIKYSNIGFLFAPAYHLAMKYAAPVRKELGFKTIFNILGPLTNPFGAKRQVIGVYSKNLAPKIIEVLKLLKAKHAFVVHGRDGMDEVSLSTLTDVYELKGKTAKSFEFNPEEYGFELCAPDKIKSAPPLLNAKIIYEILNGEPGPRAEIAILNAGFAIVVSGLKSNLSEAFTAARESIKSGSALKSLKKLVEISAK